MYAYAMSSARTNEMICCGDACIPAADYFMSEHRAKPASEMERSGIEIGRCGENEARKYCKIMEAIRGKESFRSGVNSGILPG